jgi:starvation-inducible outer membrane lipoprotein
MRIAVVIVTGALILAGCGPTRTEIRTETTRTERTLQREVVEPGTETGEEAPAGDSEIETETEERVIDTRPLIR